MNATGTAAAAEYREPERTIDGEHRKTIQRLIEYAILAPSLHNSQPWAFAIDGSAVRVFADTNRWLRAADPDQRSLRISLGCCIENFAIAAGHFGYPADVAYYPEPENPMVAARVSIPVDRHAGRFDGFDLFSAIPSRRTNHGGYAPDTIDAHVLHKLEACGYEEGVKVELTSDPRTLQEFSDLLCRADVERFANREYVDELEFWHRQGAYEASWFIEKLHEVACAAKAGNCDRTGPVLKDAHVLGMIGTAPDDRTPQIRAGRTLERIFLRAATLGLSAEPISYVMEMPDTRAEAGRIMLKRGHHPQIAFRLGYASSVPPPTPRRPISEVVVEPAAMTHAVVPFR